MRITQHVPINSPAYTRHLAGARKNIVDNMAYNSPWEYYHRLTGAVNTAVATTLYFFQTGIPGQTIQVSNLVLSGQLAPPERALVTAARFFFRSTMDRADQDSFQVLAVLRFKVGKDYYAEGPLQLYPGGSGLGGFSTNTTQQFLSNGIADPRAINAWGGANGIPIGISQSFVAEIWTTGFSTVATGVGGTGYDITCTLDAYRAREVG
jgi:hypothetical protein